MDASGRNASRQDKKIPTRVWNNVVRAAAAARAKSHDQTSEVTANARAANVILARNTTGQVIQRYGVLAFDGVENDPTASDSAESSFCNGPILAGIKPRGGETAWGIAIDPIRDGEIGRVAVNGAIPARIDIQSGTAATTAGPQPDNVEALKAGGSGATILWSEGSGSGVWCLIRIGAAAALRIGKTASTWTKGSLADVPLHEAGTPPNETSSDETLEDVVNHWGDVQSGKWVGIQMGANGHYYLVVAEC